VVTLSSRRRWKPAAHFLYTWTTSKIRANFSPTPSEHLKWAVHQSFVEGNMPNKSHVKSKTSKRGEAAREKGARKKKLKARADEEIPDVADESRGGHDED